MRVEQTAETYDAIYGSGGYEGIYDLPYRESPYYPLYRVALERLVRTRATSVLEVGSGPGAFASYLLDRTGLDYHGFDFSEVAVTGARDRTRHPDKFSVGDATDVSSYERIFDAIVCLEMLEHVPDDLGVVRAWPSKTLCVCSVPNYDSPYHERFFEDEEQIRARYSPWIEFDEIVRIKKPYLDRLTKFGFTRSFVRNLVRPQRLKRLLGLATFEEMGGWFVWTGRRK